MNRKDLPIFSGVMAYFPKAITYLSHVSKIGNDQHHRNKPLHWDKTKSTDHADALLRHLVDSIKEAKDNDGVLHLGKVAWRALALLEIYFDNTKKDNNFF